jgi:hypothetical protein
MSITHNNYAAYKQYQDPEYKIVNDQVVRFSDICVHEFTMGDVEDPDLYAVQFVMDHAVEKPYWIRQVDDSGYGHRYKIIARLSAPNQTFFRLKFQ